MWDFAAIAVAFMLAFALKVAGLHLVLAWIASCCVVPAFLLIAEFVFPDGDRAAMWPIAMYVEGIYGAAAGGAGALFASLMGKRGAETDAG
jgi:low temperature requirement protein LtrA